MPDVIAKDRLAICSVIKLSDISVTVSAHYTNTNDHKGKVHGKSAIPPQVIHYHSGC